MAKRSKPGDPSVAMAYLRVSTEDQRLGPEAQCAAIEQWCQARGVTLLAVFSDRLSGSTALQDRPAFTEALVALKEHGAGLLIVAKRDRLARDVVIAALAERAVESMGARVVSADGTGNGAEPADAFMRSVIDAASAYERALIRSRTKAALQAKKARGERTGGIPYGFDDVDGKLVPHAAEQAVIERVRALREEDVSYARIARQLRADGLMPRSGGHWHETQVRRMLVALCRTSLVLNAIPLLTFTIIT